MNPIAFPTQSFGAAMNGGLSLSPGAGAGQPVSAADAGMGDLDTSTPGYRAKVERAAEQFEGFFIQEILQQMRRSMRDIDPDEAENSKRGEDDMTDMADTMLADTLSQRRAFGIADAILRQLLPARPDTLKPPVPPVALPK